MNENQKNRMATIISGLAASGHYTHLKQVQTGNIGVYIFMMVMGIIMVLFFGTIK